MAGGRPDQRGRVPGVGVVIFVTVGSQLPFDRLVLGMDAWTGSRGRTDVFAQIGVGATPPQHMAWEETLTPQAFVVRLRTAELVVAHAGCGSILEALSARKPILVMPRRSDLREHRSDHQLATAARMQELWGISVALDQEELFTKLDELVGNPEAPASTLQESASKDLLDTIRSFIADQQGRP